MAIKSFALFIVVGLLGCTCCCKEDVESEIADIARTNEVKQASHTAAATSEPEVPTQEFPEHSEYLHSVSPHELGDLHVSPPMEVITQGISLGPESSNEKQEKLESSLPSTNIFPTLDDKQRETTETLENDLASVAVSDNQAPDQTNDTVHKEAVTLESVIEAQRRTTEKPILPGTEQDQEPQGPDDTSMKEPVDIKEDSFVPSSPAVDKVETSEVPGSALKKEGDEGTDHDRKESTEKMPTFVEWKQKMLAEHEKGGEQPPEVGSTLPKKKPTGSKSRRNYASYECGAKVLATNTEADGAGRVLNEQMDEYMLNPCKAKIWFVVELCEMIQVSQVDIANFELFSSMPKDFAVLMSDRYPTRDWTPLGTLTALDQKMVQSFELHSEAYGKYIKVELLSHYGSEHYCPLSLLRVFGTSMIDDYEQLVEKPRDPSAQDDDEEEASTERSASKNVVDRAKDVVISLFKVLRRDQDGDVDPMAGALCSDLNANCSIVNVSHQAQNATSGLLGCQRNRSRHFFDSAFQPCTTCSSSRVQSTKTQTLSETLACRFLRTALSLEDSCTIDKPNEAPELNESTESSSSKSLMTNGSYEFTAASSSVEVAVSLSTQVKTLPSASAVNDTSEVEASISLAMPISETAQLESTKTFSSPPSVMTVSSSETSVSVDLNPCDNETALEDLGSTSELAEKDSTGSTTSTDSMALQSSSQVSDSTADSATATPVIVDVPTSVKTSPSSTSVAGTEVASPVVDSALPYSVTTASGVPPTDVDSGVLIIGPETEGGSVVATVPLPLDELVPDVDLREGGIRAPPPEAGALALSSQRESVFMRINNRIKALELNMSLSGQYLEELSRRYRHQMDEMQRAFNRTVNALNKTAQKAAEKDLRQQETLVQLQQQLDNLTEVVNNLLAERQTLSKQMFENHMCLILIEAIILAAVFSLCLRRVHAPPAVLVQRESAPRPLTPGRLVLKRRTASVGHEERIEELATVVEKKQKPSDEGVDTKNSFVIVEPTMPIVVEAAPSPKEKTKKVNKQKKHKGPQRKTSLPCYPSSKADSGSRAKESRIPESKAGVLFSSRGAPRNAPPVPKVATAHATVAAAAATKGIGMGASKLPRNTECKSGQNGTLKASTLRPADCIRWSGQSCCDKDDHLGLIKFLRLPGKTPV